MKKKIYDEHVLFKDEQFDFDTGNAISPMECTGLIPRAPKTEAEFENYMDLLNFSPEDINIYNNEI